jgi:hypothetical protein
MTSYEIIIPNFPKDFNKENEEIKDLIIYLNEIQTFFDSINKLCKSILKINDSFYDEILNTLNKSNLDLISFRNDIQSVISDLILVFFQNFILIISKNNESFKNFFFDDLIKQLEPCDNIVKKINLLNEKSIVLSNQRIQYKNFENQENKLLKRLETAYQEKINFEKNEKEIYNYSLKEKIVNLLYENDKLYEDNKKERMKIYSDCKNLEINFNNQMKEFLIYIINVYIGNIKILYERINNSMNNYHNKINEILNDIIVKLIESLNLFSQKENIQEFNIEKDWTKNNFTTSEIPKEFNEITQKQLNKVSHEKKIISITLNSFKTYIQNYENYTSNINKELKNNSNLFNIQSSISNSFLFQLINFMKNLFELYIKKNQEKIKKINNNLISPLSNYNENLSNYEDKLSIKLNKFNKEYSNFKSSYSKIILDKEKLDNEFNKIKEDLEKDPSKFSEFEKKFLSIKSEIDKYQEKLYESFNKSKPLILEYNENVIKQLMNKTLNLEKNQIENIKNKFNEFLLYEKKNYEFFEENYNIKYSLFQDKGIIKNYIIEILKLFSKKYSIEFSNNFLNSEEKKINDLENIYLFNTEETIINNYLNISNIIPQSELIKLKEDIDLLISNNKEINYKNILLLKEKGKLYQDIFIIESDEKVLDNFSCTLKEKTLLQGTLYLTNKKVVFYSLLNKTNNYKTLIIIPNNDVLFVDKKNNSIELKTHKENFIFGSLLFSDSCYDLLIKTFFNEIPELRNNQSNISLKTIKSPIFENKKNFDIINNKINHIKSQLYLQKKLLEDDSNKELPNFIKEIKQINKNNLNEFFKNNQKENIEDFEYNLDCGDISLPIIFNLIYNHNINIPFFENKTYLVKLAEIKQDYYLELIQRGNYENIPKYYLTNSMEDLNYFLNENKSENVNKKITYKIKYIHPILKKRFGGPSKLEVEDEINIFIISPFCFIVEISSYLSGFMLIDTYVSTLRFIYTSKINENNNHYMFHTKLKIHLNIKFIKDTWFKTKIKSDGISDNNEFIKDIFLPLVKDILEKVNKNKKDICKYLFNPDKPLIIRIINRRKSISKENNIIQNINNNKINKNDIINVDEYINKLKAYINTFDFDTLLIVGSFIIVSFLFLIFKYDIAIIIILLIIGFSLLFYKVIDINKEVKNIKSEIYNFKNSQLNNKSLDKKQSNI